MRIYLLAAPTVLHAKHLSIDEDVAIIGSSNSTSAPQPAHGGDGRCTRGSSWTRCADRGRLPGQQPTAHAGGVAATASAGASVRQPDAPHVRADVAMRLAMPSISTDVRPARTGSTSTGWPIRSERSHRTSWRCRRSILSLPRSHDADLAAIVAEAMQCVDHRFVAALPGTPGAGWVGWAAPITGPAFGNALFSRYPVRSWCADAWGRPARHPPASGPWTSCHHRRRTQSGADRRHRDATWSRAGGEHSPVVPSRPQSRSAEAGDPYVGKPPALIMGDLNLPGGVHRAITGYRPLARHRTYPPRTRSSSSTTCSSRVSSDRSTPRRSVLQCRTTARCWRT